MGVRCRLTGRDDERCRVGGGRSRSDRGCRRADACRRRQRLGRSGRRRVRCHRRRTPVHQPGGRRLSAGDGARFGVDPVRLFRIGAGLGSHPPGRGARSGADPFRCRHPDLSRRAGVGGGPRAARRSAGRAPASGHVAPCWDGRPPAPSCTCATAVPSPRTIISTTRSSRRYSARWARVAGTALPPTSWGERSPPPIWTSTG